MAIAHRGAPDHAPENTILSFLTAQEQGADAIECDLHLTSDGKLAVIHDATTGRVWSENLNVENSTMEQLSALRPSAGFRAAFPRATGEHIPEFSAIVESIAPELQIFAELKTDSDAARSALADEIDRLGIGDRTTVISFSRDTVAFFAARGQACAWLVTCDRPSQVLDLDLPAGAAADVNCDALDANTVAAMHERGCKVYCYTVTGRDGYAKMQRFGVDGITADNIDGVTLHP